MMMLELLRCEAKSKDEALDKALESFNVRADECYYYFEESNGGLFKGKKVICTLTTKYAVKEYIKSFLSSLAYKMGTKFDIEINESMNGFSVQIVSSDNATLIGREGKTLNSIQMVLRQSLRRFGNFDFKVNLDISNYKANREASIESTTRKVCKEVLESKVPASLGAMNSYERRLVHNVVNEFDMLVTESEGEEPNRHVVIRLKEEGL